tara:strand:+ start:13848 stop:14186 length:339 start_codon:yes stop_codon:yes gene_type:complete
MKTRLPAFDVLVDMARNDPEGLETLRRSLTDAVISGAASDVTRRRLEGLQFQVDMERARAPSPLAATLRISEMMCRSLADLHRSMVAPETLDVDQPAANDMSGGNVVSFQRS